MKRLVCTLLIFCSCIAEATAKTVNVCQDLKIHANEKLDFSDNEKRLLCGDPKIPAWQTIPLPQKEKHLQGFLQERGYYNPQFSQEDGLLIVHLEEWTRVTSLAPEGNVPPTFNFDRRRKIIGQRLTPKLLTEIENWTQAEMARLGYACPKVTVAANGISGSVLVQIDSGNRQNIFKIMEDPIEDLQPEVLRRFDAFQVGDLFNARAIDLTTRRAQSDGIVQNMHLLQECTEQGVILKQKTIPGPKRLFIVGLGANTEGIILGKASLKFSRLDSLGSSLSLNTFASLRKQVAEVQADWYVLPTPSRWYLNPLIEFRREDEPQFEFIETNVRLAPALSWDAYGHHVHMVVGPQFSLTQTFEGGPEGMTQFLSAIFQAVVTSHDFEYFRESPRTGYTVDFKSSLNHENVGSSVTAQQLALHYSFLWNVLNYDPPLLILGVRGDLSTTLTDTENPNIWRLPPSFRYYRGGSANLRGFSLGELPSPGPGALTAASLGVEARLGEVLPWHLEPLAFFDVGALGQTSLDLDNPLYWSPGGGLRWASPIGNIRGTVAHGFVHGSHFSPSDLSHWQFYLSFGEEF